MRETRPNERLESDLGIRVYHAAGFNVDCGAWIMAIPDDVLVLAKPLIDVRQKNGLSRQAATSVCFRHLHQLAAWEHSGKPIYRMTSDLVAALMLTDVDTDLPAMPFDGFEVQFPTDFLKYNTENYIESALITRSIDPDGPVFQARIQITNGTVFNVTGTWDTDFENTLEDGIAHGLRVPDAIRPVFVTIRHVVQGLCSFLATKVEIVRAENEKAVLREKANGKVRSPIYIVGKTVKISQELHRLAKSAKLGEPLWKLKHRYTVAGHFRWQPVGHRLPPGAEGPMNAKKIRIEPYWKGPAGAEVWQHIYEPTT